MTRETTTSTRAAKRVRGTVSYEDQTISTRAIALLAGAQHASIDVHGAGEEGARLSLTWGTLLLGFTAVDQVDALAEAFGESKAAARQIPERLDPKILSAEIGDEAYLPAISLARCSELCSPRSSSPSLTGSSPRTRCCRDGGDCPSC